jgi:hypothetical protein
MGKDLTELGNLHRQLVADRVGPGEHEPTFLRETAIKAKANKCHRFQDLYRYLNVEYRMWCWPQLNRNAAAGVDGVTVVAYEKELKANIEALVERLKAKRYRAKWVRRRYIPKEGGKERPLGIAALEDKLIQLACAKLLSVIYEQEFMSGSYSYRPERSALDGVRDLTFDLQYGV